MNREMLKECIADAKTIRETAIASAKVALEEAFTPQLTAMFAEKLNELELEEEVTEESVNEMHGVELEEDFNLEEILAELSMEEEQEPTMEDDNMEESLDENVMLEEMSDEEIEELVMQVIDDMIASGKLMPGEGEEEGEEEDIEDMEDMDDVEVGDEDEEIDIDEILSEVDSVEETEKVDEAFTPELAELASNIYQYAIVGNWDAASNVMSQFLATDGGAAAVGGMITAAGALPFVGPKIKEKLVGVLAKAKEKAAKNQKPTKEAKEEDTTTEMEETINELRKELNEVNLLNAKLLYTNKIFKAKNLTESEKIKVLNTFDKAETVKEVKLVFETLTESFKATTAKKNPIKESLGSASKTISTATPKQPIIESNEAFARMQRLAGLKK
jgi:hypothetical protein